MLKAVIDTKLMYGLESLQLPPMAAKTLDTFQLKGFRKIMGMKTTYVNRANTNEEVYRRVRAAMGGDRVVRLSEKHCADKIFSRTLCLQGRATLGMTWRLGGI